MKYRLGTTEAFYDWCVGVEGETTPIAGEGHRNLAYCLQQVIESHSFWQELVAGTANPNGIGVRTNFQRKVGRRHKLQESTKEFDLPRKSKPESQPRS